MLKIVEVEFTLDVLCVCNVQLKWHCIVAFYRLLNSSQVIRIPWTLWPFKVPSDQVFGQTNTIPVYTGQ